MEKSRHTKQGSKNGMIGVSSHNKLPIDEHVSSIAHDLKQAKLQLLVAAPGTGKSTRVPPYLSKKFGKTLLIQPRRTAAKMLAHRIAKEWGCNVGEEVGYQIRFDASYSSSTKLLVATEGIVRQRMLSDPFLEEFAVIILDEIHERSLNSDLLLGWFKELTTIRDDLHILLISATIDPKRYTVFFDTLSVYTVEGRTYPVQIHYEEQVSSLTFQERLSNTLRQALEKIHPQSSILVFLPGRKSIEEAIERNKFSSHQSLPLYSSLPFEQQLLLFNDHPKIIFSTNVAESSITLPNIGAVIDSGLEKVSIDRGGFGQLKTTDIAQESADQRAGRAGRTQEGHCFRMWRSSARRRKHRQAEIERADLSQAFLHILDWGMTIEDFSWLTPPSPQRKETTVRQLQLLSLVDDGITDKGKRIARLPVHPRLGCVLQKAYNLGVFRPCAQLATLLLEDKQVTPHNVQEQCNTIKLNNRIYRQLTRHFPKSNSTWNTDAIQKAWISGYKDRISMYIPSDQCFTLSGGGRAQSTYNTPWFLALQIHQYENKMRKIIGGLSLQYKNLPTSKRTTHKWNVDRVEAKEETCIGSITVHAHPCPVDIQIAQNILCEHATETNALSHTKESNALLQRMSYCAHLLSFPTLTSLLPLLCMGKRSFSELKDVNLYTFISHNLSWKQKKCLEKNAPTHFQTPSKARIPIDYQEDTPVIKARIQQLFGLYTHPCIGKKPVVIELLAPNNRPQQRTQDIVNFWSGSYLSIRKELRGRYPKHAWPENPTKEDAQNHPKRNR